MVTPQTAYHPFLVPNSLPLQVKLPQASPAILSKPTLLPMEGALSGASSVAAETGTFLLNYRQGTSKK